LAATESSFPPSARSDGGRGCAARRMRGRRLGPTPFYARESVWRGVPLAAPASRVVVQRSPPCARRWARWPYTVDPTRKRQRASTTGWETADTRAPNVGDTREARKDGPRGVQRKWAAPRKFGPGAISFFFYFFIYFYSKFKFKFQLKFKPVTVLASDYFVP
jgi:hypothetical protein